MKPLQLIGKKKIDILKTPSSDLLKIDQDILSLAERMVVTCRVKNGQALAAVQVGIPISIIVFRNGDTYANISLKNYSDEEVEAPEGCLSLPGRWYLVPRSTGVEVSGIRLNGESFEKKAEGLEARVWQHEYDHILANLICDGEYKEVRG